MQTNLSPYTEIPLLHWETNPTVSSMHSLYYCSELSFCPTRHFVLALHATMCYSMHFKFSACLFIKVVPIYMYSW